MRTRELAIGVCALAALGCSGGPIFLSSAGLSALVVAELDGEVARLEAFALEPGGRLDHAPPESGALYAIGYARPLEELGIRPGPILPAADGARLPAADQVHELDGAGWIALPSIPSPIAELELNTLDGCASFDLAARSIPLEGGIPAAAIALDEQRVFVTSTAGQFHIHSPRESVQLTALATTTPYLAAFARDGEIWLLGPGRRFARGHPDRGFTPAPDLPLDATEGTGLDGARAGSPFELFATDGLGGVAHFDGERWKVLRQPSGPNPNGTRQGIAWVEPGLAILVGVAIEVAIEISAEGRERQVRFDLPGRASPDSVWSVANIEGRGVVLGTRHSVTYTRGDQGFEMLEIPNITPRADVICDLGRGGFFIGGQGVFAQYRPNDQLCPILAIPGGIDSRAVVPVGTGFFMILDGFEARSLVYGARL